MEKGELEDLNNIGLSIQINSFSKNTPLTTKIISKIINTYITGPGKLEVGPPLIIMIFNFSSSRDINYILHFTLN